jgi:DNA polymerase/3'-5' exonuclease PolX
MEYVSGVEKIFDTCASKYQVPGRIPSRLFSSIVSKTELVIIILEHMDYLARVKNINNPYGFASRALYKLNKNIELMNEKELLSVKGIGPVTLKIIREILSTGSSSYYEKLL